MTRALSHLTLATLLATVCVQCQESEPTLGPCVPVKIFSSVNSNSLFFDSVKFGYSNKKLVHIWYYRNGENPPDLDVISYHSNGQIEQIKQYFPLKLHPEPKTNTFYYNDKGLMEKISVTRENAPYTDIFSFNYDSLNRLVGIELGLLSIRYEYLDHNNVNKVYYRASSDESLMLEVLSFDSIKAFYDESPVLKEIYEKIYLIPPRKNLWKSIRSRFLINSEEGLIKPSSYSLYGSFWASVFDNNSGPRGMEASHLGFFSAPEGFSTSLVKYSCE